MLAGEKEKQDSQGEWGIADVRTARRITNEASMLLKTQEGMSETKLKRTQNEALLSAEMRTSRAKFELSVISQVSAGTLNWKGDRGRGGAGG